MAKKNSTRSTPKRGAFPTPRSVLSAATPYEPEKPDQSGLAADQPRSESYSPEESRRSGTRTGGIAMSDKAGSAGNMGTAGTPPPPSGSKAAGSQAGAGNVGTAGTPPPPK